MADDDWTKSIVLNTPDPYAGWSPTGIAAHQAMVAESAKGPGAKYGTEALGKAGEAVQYAVGQLPGLMSQADIAAREAAQAEWEATKGLLGTQYGQTRGLMQEDWAAQQARMAKDRLAGGRRISQEAARGMAAAMGQAGGMPIGGGSAAMLRQQGKTAGQTAADFYTQQSAISDAAQRAQAARMLEAQQAHERGMLAGSQGYNQLMADLTQKNLQNQMGWLGETAPGLWMALADTQAEAAQREEAAKQQTLGGTTDILNFMARLRDEYDAGLMAWTTDDDESWLRDLNAILADLRMSGDQAGASLVQAEIDKVESGFYHD